MKNLLKALAPFALAAASLNAHADQPAGHAHNIAACAALPSHAELKAALIAARQQDNAGFNLDMWGATVARDGTVCAVAASGKHWGDQWPGSRVIAAQKAHTANAFGLPGLALATANPLQRRAARRLSLRHPGEQPG